jgi:DNA-binding LacI/PurR family transcriptional regulator
VKPLTGRHFAPKYVELAHVLLRQIARQGLRPGDRLGTEVELGRKHGLSRVTVRQALAMLEKEGYISREKARGTFVKASLERGRHLELIRGTVVVVCSNEQASHSEDDIAFATVLRSLERTLAKQGFNVQILGIGEDEQADWVRLQKLAQSEDVQGICTIGPCLERYRELLFNVPVVTSCSPYASRPPLVRQDLHEVARECTGYLLTRGHHDIAMLCGSWMDQKAFAIFAEGYRQAFEAADRTFRRSRLNHAYPGESLEKLTRSILEEPQRPTALFAENWQVCRVALAVAQELNLRIPRDLSIIAYGQNVLQIVSPVAVTAYVPDTERIGHTVAQLVLDIVDGNDVPQAPIAVAGKLIERDSVLALTSRR